MNNKAIKIILCLFILSMIFCLIPKNIYAADDVIKGADDFINLGTGQKKIKENDLKSASDKIYNILFVAGIAVALCVGAVLGIQFMTGSMEQQAKVKESLIPFIVGCIIVFGAFGIWKAVATIVQSI